MNFRRIFDDFWNFKRTLWHPNPMFGRSPVCQFCLPQNLTKHFETSQKLWKTMGNSQKEPRNRLGLMDFGPDVDGLLIWGRNTYWLTTCWATNCHWLLSLTISTNFHEFSLGTTPKRQYRSDPTHYALPAYAAYTAWSYALRYVDPTLPFLRYKITVGHHGGTAVYHVEYTSSIRAYRTVELIQVAPRPCHFSVAAKYRAGK